MTVMLPEYDGRAMTAAALSESLMTTAGTQLEACVRDFPADHAQTPLVPEAMSATHMLQHLTEVYLATRHKLETGNDWDWGSYRAPSDDFDAVRAVWGEERAKTVAALVAAGDREDALHLASDFVVGHDYYHVGQLVTLRLHVEPSWNSYAIYGF
jgi:hypothetical protein